MKRIPGYVTAALLVLAVMGASPPPPDGPERSIPQATAGSRQSSSRVQTRLESNRKKARPYQVGTASWYGRYFHGRPTASGEPYDMFRLTAAHRTLKLGTWVRVTNLRNGRSVVVRINDRGPVPRA